MISTGTFSVLGVARNGLRPLVRAAREIPLLPACRLQTSGPRAVFLPAKGRADGAANLRAFRIAAALKPLGWATLVLPPTLTLTQRRKLIRRFGADVIVLQSLRHPLSLPDLYPGQRLVLDMDDADFHLPHLARRVIGAMPQFDAVIAGSRYIADWCRRAGARSVSVVWTGAPLSARPYPAHAQRRRVLIWAQSRPETYEIEAEHVRQVLIRLKRRCAELTLRLYDRSVDSAPGFAKSFTGVCIEWLPRLSYRRYLKSFEDAAIGLAPLSHETPFSRGKSFGKVLGYIDRGVPTLASNTGEFVDFFNRESGVLSSDPADWAEAIEHLLEDPAARDRMANAARERMARCLTTEATATRVDGILRNALTSHPPMKTSETSVRSA